jgi:hypothetical protein
MADQDHELCDSCHERPATSHVCRGDGGKGRSLCVICIRPDLEAGGLVQRFAEAMTVGNCKYCGAPAAIGYGGFSLIEGEQFNLLCQPCQEDWAEFARRPENVVPDVVSEDEVERRRVVTQLAERQKRQDEFIQQRVGGRERGVRVPLKAV